MFRSRFASHTGTVVVFRAADTLDVLARDDLGESITATPAIAEDTTHVRTERHLWVSGSASIASARTLRAMADPGPWFRQLLRTFVKSW